MRVSIKQIPDKKAEQVVIECVEINDKVERIKSYVTSLGNTLSGTLNNRLFTFSLYDVYYFEAIDDRVFAYTDSEVYELKTRLYELEHAYSDKGFVRCAKPTLLNLMAVESLSPGLNGRFIAHMVNKEKIIISRQYVPEIKRILMGGK